MDSEFKLSKLMRFCLQSLFLLSISKKMFLLLASYIRKNRFTTFIIRKKSIKRYNI